MTSKRKFIPLYNNSEVSGPGFGRMAIPPLHKTLDVTFFHPSGEEEEAALGRFQPLKKDDLERVHSTSVHTLFVQILSHSLRGARKAGVFSFYLDRL